MQEIYLRRATPEDAAELLSIYAPYVEKTVITFELKVPTLEEFKSRIAHTLTRYPYIVACQQQKIIGYAYTSAFHVRAAYDWCAETSIYVAMDAKKQGVGKLLYKAIEDISKAQHILNLNACIAYPSVEDEYLTRNSVEFHKHLGYSITGEFHQCGFKFGRWYGMVWMEKMLGEHTAHPLPVIPFSSLDNFSI